MSGNEAMERTDSMNGIDMTDESGSYISSSDYDDYVLNKITKFSHGLKIDVEHLAGTVLSSISHSITESQIDELIIRTASDMIIDEPDYSRLAARFLSEVIDFEVTSEGIDNFIESLAKGNDLGLINHRVFAFAISNRELIEKTLNAGRTDLFEFFGLKTLHTRYLLKHPVTRNVIENPQYFFMRIACALSRTPQEMVDLYNKFSNLEYIPSSPTLFNSGTVHEQLSSCFLCDSPKDDLDAIYDKYKDIAKLSKYSGGIGLSYHRVRSFGSLIVGTNSPSNGIVPWLKTLDSSIAAVSQGGKRKGACCVYLESWHADILDFLELRDNTGDINRRTYNLNIANWIPDIFMRRVNNDEDWSLFDPKEFPEFPDLYGESFERAYTAAEAAGKAKKVIKARDLYGRMMKTLAQTGNGWFCFKDASNLKSNQTGIAGNTIHLSNLCTEILEVTSDAETAVCNLGSINLSNHVVDGAFDWQKLANTVHVALNQLNYVIDLNHYPIQQAASSNMKWRPVGLGMMGLQDVFFKLNLPFDSVEARQLSAKISEEIYFSALSASADLAEKYGSHPNFHETRAAQGELQFDSWGVTPSDPARWEALRQRIMSVGLRNSLIIAIAPTATIASITGCGECIEPQVSNLFKRETMSGDFLQINKYLVRDLQERGLWTPFMIGQIKMAEGSVQDIDGIPDDLKLKYRTAWEIPMRSLIDMAADRGPYIDQSQSLNLFVENPSIGKLSSMYNYAWSKGLKTTYYLRSRPATKIAKTTVNVNHPEQVTTEQAVACSLENPGSCEACQ